MVYESGLVVRDQGWVGLLAHFALEEQPESLP